MFGIRRKDVKRNMTISNILTFLRLLGATFIPVVFMAVSANFFFIYCGIIAVTDAVDGFIARKFNQETRLGKIMDPIADRFYAVMVIGTLVITTFISPIILILTLSREIFSLPAVVYCKMKGREYVPNAGKMGKLTTNLQFATFGLLILAGGSIVTIVFIIATFVSGIVTAFKYSRKTGFNNYCLSGLKRISFF